MALGRSRSVRTSKPATSLTGLIPTLILLLFQFVLALTVCGLYGTDLHSSHKPHKYVRSKWGYAEFVGALSAFTCLVYVFMLFVIRVGWTFVWDLVLFILWVAVFGVFGAMYIHDNAHGSSSVQRMKNAVWVDLANMLLWLISAVYGATWFFCFGEKRSLHTGRATV